MFPLFLTAGACLTRCCGVQPRVTGVGVGAVCYMLQTPQTRKGKSSARLLTDKTCSEPIGWEGDSTRHYGSVYLPEELGIEISLFCTQSTGCPSYPFSGLKFQFPRSQLWASKISVMKGGPPGLFFYHCFPAFILHRVPFLLHILLQNQCPI